MTVGALKTAANFKKKIPLLFVCVVFVQEGGGERENILNRGFVTTWVEVGNYVFILVECREIVILKKFRGEADKKITRGGEE